MTSSELNEADGSGAGFWFADNLDQIRAIRLDNLTVLIVDDSTDNQILFSRILKSAGAKIINATNGLEAIEAARITRFDLIIMDIRMPKCDGYEATKLIRQEGFCGPVIALTANQFIDERERCLDAGCDDFYLKPIDRLSLLQAVSKATLSRI
jgi:CheY-like chemotaxis protein